MSITNALKLGELIRKKPSMGWDAKAARIIEFDCDLIEIFETIKPACAGQQQQGVKERRQAMNDLHFVVRRASPLKRNSHARASWNRALLERVVNGWDLYKAAP
ncbi:hypothetical protein PGTUg99_028219 [Puccinia graminis f. sp. tritici]|uniref:Uncharacterized protein n=1 Tax=Puccinia graminis f. sp. tritici TaxID=56615 RepID=A0A5B0S881_PUCGR|nr:hypothetical protein PGTUg99_028219 [Puccinia graminis f. sp. tritici]